MVSHKVLADSKEGGVEGEKKEHVEEGETEDRGDLLQTLACKHCSFPFSAADDIIMQKAQAVGDMVYHYELDLLDKEDIPCYSSDNPHAERYDVIRLRAHEYVVPHGTAYAHHSFFPGYKWTSVCCGCCGLQLGWGFTAHTPEAVSVEAIQRSTTQTRPASPFSFFGIILTNLTPLECTEEYLIAARQQLKAENPRIGQTRRRRCTIC